MKQIGFRYILLEALAGKVLDTRMAISISAQHKKKFVAQLAGYFHELSIIRFSKFGRVLYSSKSPANLFSHCVCVAFVPTLLFNYVRSLPRCWIRAVPLTMCSPTLGAARERPLALQRAADQDNITLPLPNSNELLRSFFSFLFFSFFLLSLESLLSFTTAPRFSTLSCTRFQLSIFTMTACEQNSSSSSSSESAESQKLTIRSPIMSESTLLSPAHWRALSDLEATSVPQPPITCSARTTKSLPEAVALISETLQVHSQRLT
jgi:hypothetical protein